MKRSYSQIEKSITSKLHTDGYVCVPSAITIPTNVYDEIILQADKKAHPIFNHHETRSKNDRKRKQTNVSMKKKFMDDFLFDVNKYLVENINSNLSVNNWVILHSKPGCGDQATHCDDALPGTMTNIDDEYIPLAVLVSLMPNTKIHVWPKSHHITNQSRPIKRRTIEMNSGDIFIFRGDLVHAGSSYDIDNYRLHAYMDSPYAPRILNRTWLIDRHADDIVKKTIII